MLAPGSGGPDSRPSLFDAPHGLKGVFGTLMHRRCSVYITYPRYDAVIGAIGAIESDIEGRGGEGEIMAS